ncbi:946_t:CDS:1, partial [Dentiscutata heterogama]
LTMISKRAHLYKRAVKKRVPSDFILYKNQNKLNPNQAKEAYRNLTKDVRIAFERQAEMLRLEADSNFIVLDETFVLDKTFFKDTSEQVDDTNETVSTVSTVNEDTSKRVDDTNATVSTINGSETKLCPHFNNVTNNSSSLEQPIFQTSCEDLMIQNEISFIYGNEENILI